MINWQKIDRQNLPDGTVLCKTKIGRISIGFLDIDDDDKVCCISVGEYENLVDVCAFAYIANVPTEEEIQGVMEKALISYKPNTWTANEVRLAVMEVLKFFQTLKIEIE